MALKAEREAERPWSTHSPDREWDYVVVGSGMGGMTTAAMLARLGRRVLVLEQHWVPGGFTHTFRRQKWRWDVGVHAVGEVGERAMVGRILSRLTEGKLTWESLGPVYDEFHYPDLRIDFPSTRQQFAENLRAAFPVESPAIDRYLHAVRDVSSHMRSYYLSRLLPPAWSSVADPLLARRAHRLLGERTDQALARITSSERLRSILTAQWGYYGVPPARSSFAMHALVAKHFWHGGYYPRGGSARIAETLLGTVAAHGGWTRIKADVAELVMAGGRAAGVRLKSGEVIRAKKVVSAMGARPTVTRLLPPGQRQQPWARSIAALRPSPCHLCLYVGLKGDPRAAGASAANKWFYETWASDATEWNIRDPGSQAPVLYCSFPSLKDPLHDAGPEQLHTAEVVTFVPYDAFESWKDERWKRRGEDYDALKQELEKRMLEQFLKHMPALAPLTAYTELSTPLSTETFTRAPLGAIYGLEPTPERFANRYLRPRTPIPGLFMSGGDMASVGVIGAMVGGALAAIAAEPAPALARLRDDLRH
jgi:all-trans-retinol 13,14-reductase